MNDEILGEALMKAFSTLGISDRQILSAWLSMPAGWFSGDPVYEASVLEGPIARLVKATEDAVKSVETG